MNLTNLITELFKASEFKTPNSLADYINANFDVKVTEPFVRAFLEGSKQARIKEDVIMSVLTENILINLQNVPSEISFQVVSEEDKAYYLERGNEIIKQGDFHYLTTNDILHSMRDFVQLHLKTGRKVNIRSEESSIVLFTDG